MRETKIAEDELKVALRQEIGEGLVAVERDEDQVIVTVGAGGAFASGSATLTNSAKEIMSKIAGVNADGTGKITVSGHTDDVPLIFGSQFRDNWDLAAARSASVVQELEDTGMIPAGRMEAVSYSESKPIESNSTADGRSVNRRIEIERLITKTVPASQPCDKTIQLPLATKLAWDFYIGGSLRKRLLATAGQYKIIGATFQQAINTEQLGT